MNTKSLHCYRLFAAVLPAVLSFFVSFAGQGRSFSAETGIFNGYGYAIPGFSPVRFHRQDVDEGNGLPREALFTDSLTGTRVIAHRGYWDTEGSAQNSIAALKKAQALRIYGSEFDVNRTLDGKLVVAHGPKEQEIELQKVDYADLSGIRLKNGEKIPLLEDYLKYGKKDRHTRLVLELKPHDTPGIESAAVREIVKLIKKYKLTERTDFISFSLHACREFARLMPGSNVAYLDGKYTPAELKNMGINGLDYHYSWFEKHPEWVEEAHRLGMTVNVWTVSTREQLQKMINLGVDFLTTNDPVLAKELLRR